MPEAEVEAQEGIPAEGAAEEKDRFAKTKSAKARASRKRKPEEVGKDGLTNRKRASIQRRREFERERFEEKEQVSSRCNCEEHLD